MEKKIYIQPSANVFQVNPSEVICGSGETNATIGNGDTNPGFNNGTPIGGNSASSRSSWDEYEGR